ncbi:MAG: hypothetical protein U0L85_03355 [Bacilli bacterium]|nr:hypothetical protein [Bacilli bacterium]
MKRIIIIFIMLLGLSGCKSNGMIDSETLYYIISINDNKAVLYPGFYERELHEEQKEDFIEVSLAEEINCYDIKVNTIIDSDGNKTSNKTVLKIELNTIKAAVEYNNAFVYLKCNEKNEINEITLYGELTVWE